MAGNKFNKKAEERVERLKDLLNQAYACAPELKDGIPGNNKSKEFQDLFNLFGDIDSGCKIDKTHRDYDEMMNNFVNGLDTKLTQMENVANTILAGNTDVRNAENAAARQALLFAKTAKSYLTEIDHERQFDTDATLERLKLAGREAAGHANDMNLHEQRLRENLQDGYSYAKEASLDFVEELKKRVDLDIPEENKLNHVGSVLVNEYAKDLEDGVASIQTSSKDKLDQIKEAESSANKKLAEEYKAYRAFTEEKFVPNEMDGAHKMQMKEDINKAFSKNNSFISVDFEFGKITGQYHMTRVDYNKEFQRKMENLSAKDLDAEIAKYSPERRAQVKQEYAKVADDYNKLNQSCMFAESYIETLQHFNTMTEFKAFIDQGMPIEYALKGTEQVLALAPCMPGNKSMIQDQLQTTEKLLINQYNHQKEYLKTHSELDEKSYREFEKELNNHSLHTLNMYQTTDARTLPDVMKRKQELNPLHYESEYFDANLAKLKALKEIRYGEKGYNTQLNEENRNKYLDKKNREKLWLQDLSKQALNILDVAQKREEFEVTSAADEKARLNYAVAVGQVGKCDRERDYHSNKFKEAYANVNKEADSILQHADESEKLALNSMKTEFTDLYQAMSAVSADHFILFGHRNTELFNTMMEKLNAANEIIQEAKPLTEEQKNTLNEAKEAVSNYERERKPKDGKRFKGTDQGQKRYDIAKNMKSFFEKYVGPEQKQLNTAFVGKTDIRLEATLTRSILADVNPDLKPLSTIIQENDAKYRENAEKHAEAQKQKVDKKLTEIQNTYDKRRHIKPAQPKEAEKQQKVDKSKVADQQQKIEKKGPSIS